MTAGVEEERHRWAPPPDLQPCGIVAFTDDGIVRYASDEFLAMIGRDAGDVVGSSIERALTIGSRIFYQTHLFPMVRMQGSANEIYVELARADGGVEGALLNARRAERQGVHITDCALMLVRERRKFEDALVRARRDAEEARDAAERHRRELYESNAQLEEQALELEIIQQQQVEQAELMEQQTEELRVLNDALLTRSEELEQQTFAAESANQAKSAFLAAMSHELRTPLNAIGGYVQILQMGIHGPMADAQQDTLSKVARAQRHLLRLINEVLNLARIESGGVHYQRTAVPVAELVSSVMPMIEPQLASQRLTFRHRLDGAPVAIADREKSEQVLLNLLGNAVKFTEPHGHVELRAGQSGDRVWIEVADTGIGIAHDRLEHVFEPFVQVDMSPSGRVEGTGLGLAISRDLARGMGGELSVRSAPGMGSTFRLELPAATTG